MVKIIMSRCPPMNDVVSTVDSRGERNRFFWGWEGGGGNGVWRSENRTADKRKGNVEGERERERERGREREREEEEEEEEEEATTGCQSDKRCVLTRGYIQIVEFQY